MARRAESDVATRRERGASARSHTRAHKKGPSGEREKTCESTLGAGRLVRARRAARGGRRNSALLRFSLLKVVETVSDADDRELNRFARSVALQNAIDRPNRTGNDRDRSTKRTTQIDTGPRHAPRSRVPARDLHRLRTRRIRESRPCPRRHSRKKSKQKDTQFSIFTARAVPPR